MPSRASRTASWSSTITISRDIGPHLTISGWTSGRSSWASWPQAGPSFVVPSFTRDESHPLRRGDDSSRLGAPTPRARRRRSVMPHYLSPSELDRTAPAETGSFRAPVPTQIGSNGEETPLAQTPEQQRVEARIKERAEQLGPRHGVSRRGFLASAAGMAAAFLTMNEVFGPLFEVTAAEAQQPGVAGGGGGGGGGGAGGGAVAGRRGGAAGGA